MLTEKDTGSPYTEEEALEDIFNHQQEVLMNRKERENERDAKLDSLLKTLEELAKEVKKLVERANQPENKEVKEVTKKGGK